MPVAAGEAHEQVHPVGGGPGPGPERAMARESETAVEPDQPPQVVDDRDRRPDLESATLGIGAEEALEVEPDQLEGLGGLQRRRPAGREGRGSAEPLHTARDRVSESGLRRDPSLARRTTSPPAPDTIRSGRPCSSQSATAGREKPRACLTGPQQHPVGPGLDPGRAPPASIGTGRA